MRFLREGRTGLACCLIESMMIVYKYLKGVNEDSIVLKYFGINLVY